MGLKKVIRRLMGNKPKPPPPNFTEQRAAVQRQEQRLLKEQKIVNEQLERMKRERKKNIELLKTIAKHLVVETRSNFSQVLEQDQKLSQETAEVLGLKEQEYRFKAAKLKQIGETLHALETGNLSPLERLAQDRQALALFPSEIGKLFVSALKSGFRGWKAFEEAEVLQQELQNELQMEHQQALQNLNECPAAESSFVVETTESKKEGERKYLQEKAQGEREKQEKINAEAQERKIEHEADNSNVNEQPKERVENEQPLPQDEDEELPEHAIPLRNTLRNPDENAVPKLETIPDPKPLKDLQTALFQGLINQQFSRRELELERELMKLLESLKVKLKRGDKKLRVFLDAELKDYYNQPGNTSPLLGQYSPKFLLSLVKRMSLNEFLRKLNVKFFLFLLKNPKLFAQSIEFKAKLKSLDLELELVQKVQKNLKQTKKTAKLEDHEAQIQVAVNIINEALPKFEKEAVFQAFALACIGVSASTKNSNAETSNLVQALCFVAMLRVFYQRKIKSRLENGQEAVLPLASTTSLKNFIAEFRNHILNPAELPFINLLLDLSRLPKNKRNAYIEAEYLKGHEVHYHFYCPVQKKWMDLRESCDLLYAYRSLQETADYAPGDSEIYNEALNTVQLLGENTSLQVQAYRGRLPLASHPWVMQEIELKNSEEWDMRFVSLQDYLNETQESTLSVYQALQERGQKEIRKKLRVPLVKKVFLPNPEEVAGLEQALQANPESPAAAFTLIHLEGNKFKFKMNPGQYVLEFSHRKGKGYHARAIHISGRGILKTPIRSRYTLGEEYRLEFNGPLTGNVIFQYGEQHIEYRDFKNEKHLDFTSLFEGPLNITINPEDAPEFTVAQKTIVEAPVQSFAQKLKPPEWNSISFTSEQLESEQQENELLFKWKEEPFFRVRNSELFLELELEIEPLQDKVLYKQYRMRLRDTLKCFENGSTQQKMKKALLSCHWLLSKDLMFGPLFILGYSIYCSENASLQIPFLKLLSKQIALFEIMEKIGVQKTAQFIEQHMNEFPKYWSQIFQSVHENNNLRPQALILLTVQTYLHVLKKELINIDCDFLLEMIQKIYTLQNKKQYRQSEIELEQDLYEPLFPEWLLEIHRRWGRNTESLEKTREYLDALDSTEEEAFADLQVRIFNQATRRRTLLVGLGNQVVNHCVAGSTELQVDCKKLVKTEKMLSQGLIDIQKGIKQCVNQRRNISNAETQYAIARSQAKHKQKKMIVKSLVGIGLGAFFAPLLTKTIFVGLSKLGGTLGALGKAVGTTSTAVNAVNTTSTALKAGNALTNLSLAASMTREAVNAALQAGIQTAFTGGNIPKSMLQNFAIGGMTGGMDKLMSVPGVIYQVSSPPQRAAIKSGTTALLSTSMNGGKLIPNVAGSAGAAALSNKLFEDPTVKTAVLRAAVTSMIESVIHKTPLSSTQLLNVAGAGVQSVSSCVGENIVARQEERLTHARIAAQTPKAVQGKSGLYFNYENPNDPNSRFDYRSYANCASETKRSQEMSRITADSGNNKANGENEKYLQLAAADPLIDFYSGKIISPLYNVETSQELWKREPYEPLKEPWGDKIPVSPEIDQIEKNITKHYLEVCGDDKPRKLKPLWETYMMQTEMLEDAFSNQKPILLKLAAGLTFEFFKETLDATKATFDFMNRVFVASARADAMILYPARAEAIGLTSQPLTPEQIARQEVNRRALKHKLSHPIDTMSRGFTSGLNWLWQDSRNKLKLFSTSLENGEHFQAGRYLGQATFTPASLALSGFGCGKLAVQSGKVLFTTGKNIGKNVGKTVFPRLKDFTANSLNRAHDIVTDFVPIYNLEASYWNKVGTRIDSIENGFPLFKPRYFWFETHQAQKNGKQFRGLSLEDVRTYPSPGDEMIYVINNKGKLIISDPGNCVEHLYLSHGETVLAAGDVHLSSGNLGNNISLINNRSGCFWPKGDHLRGLVEGTFIENGYCEALGTFVNVNERLKNEMLIFSAGKPLDIYFGFSGLNARQSNFLSQLPSANSVLQLKKSFINVNDLAALTAHTQNEFAMFTLGSRRLIVRGDRFITNIMGIGSKLLEEGWTWSAHTHVGKGNASLIASGVHGDLGVLEMFNQQRSLILNSLGSRTIFKIKGEQVYVDSFSKKSSKVGNIESTSIRKKP